VCERARSHTPTRSAPCPRTFIYAGLGGSFTHASPVVTIVSLVLLVGLAVLGALTALAERRVLRAAATP